MRTFRWVGWVFCLWLAAGSAGCSPDVKTWQEAWRSAVQAKDGAAAWKLLDQASRERVVTALRKTQERAQKDEAFRAMLASTFTPIDPSLPPEELAQKLLAAQLELAPDAGSATLSAKGASYELSLGGRVTPLHLEDGVWRADVDALVLSEAGAAVLVEYVTPLGPGPKAPAAPGATPTRGPVSDAIPVDPKALGKLEKIQEVQSQLRTSEGVSIQITRQTESGKILWYRRFLLGSDSYVEVDMGRHTYSVANGGTGELSRMYMADDNKDVRDDQRVEKYKIIKGAGDERTLRLFRTRYLDDKKVLHVEEPDDKVPALMIVHSQKDSKGGDLAKMSAEERAKAVVEKDRMVNDALVGFRIHERSVADYDKALARAAEIKKLPDGLGSAARAVILYEEGRIGRAPDVRDASFELIIAPEPGLRMTEVVWDAGKQRIEDRARTLVLAPLSARKPEIAP